MVPQLFIHRDRHASRIRVRGSVDSSISSAFAHALARDVKTLAAGDPTIELELDNLEFDDDDAIEEAVNAIRELLREAPLVLRGAPEVLASTLRKAGILGGELRLEAIRHEPLKARPL